MLGHLCGTGTRHLSGAGTVSKTEDLFVSFDDISGDSG